MRKKVVLLVTVLCLALVGCGSKTEPDTSVKESEVVSSESKEYVPESPVVSSVSAEVNSPTATSTKVEKEVYDYGFGEDDWKQPYIYSGDRDAIDNASITVDGVTYAFYDGVGKFLDSGWYLISDDGYHKALTEEEAFNSRANEYALEEDGSGIVKDNKDYRLAIRHDYADGGYIELFVNSDYMEPHEGLHWKDVPIAECVLKDYENTNRAEEMLNPYVDFQINLPLGTITSGDDFYNVKETMGAEYMNPGTLIDKWAHVSWRDHFAMYVGDYDVRVEFGFKDGKLYEFEYCRNFGLEREL